MGYLSLHVHSYITHINILTTVFPDLFIIIFYYCFLQIPQDVFLDSQRE